MTVSENTLGNTISEPGMGSEWKPPFFAEVDTTFIPEKYRSCLQGMTKQIDRPDLKVFRSSPFREQPLCLKVICCESSEERFKRAVRECEITEMLRGNPGIVWMLDCDIDLVSKRVALLEEDEKPLPEYLSAETLYPITIAHIGTGILDSLMQIQKAGFLYIDVHPGNIYYDEKRVKIGDFGSVLEKETAGDYHELTGVRSFMAPEVWKDKMYSVQSVLYSTGMVLYWILNRCTPPFMPIRTSQEAFEKRMSGDPFPVPQFIQKYPEEMKELYMFVEKMTAYDPADRFQSFIDARRALSLIGYDFFVKEMEKSSKVSFTVGNGDLEKTVPPRFYSPVRTILQERSDLS